MDSDRSGRETDEQLMRAALALAQQAAAAGAKTKKAMSIKSHHNVGGVAV